MITKTPISAELSHKGRGKTRSRSRSRSRSRG